MREAEPSVGEEGEVTLRLFAGLRDLVGKRELKLPADGMTIKRLLRELAARYGEPARRFLFDQRGDLWESVPLVNDEAVDRRAEVLVKSGDVVSILLPTAGGAM